MTQELSNLPAPDLLPPTQQAGTSNTIPDEFVLYSNQASALHKPMTIRFGLPKTSVVRLMIYNVLGKRVKVLVDGLLAEGMHEVVFETDDLPHGTYLCQLKTPEGSIVKKLLLAK